MFDFIIFHFLQFPISQFFKFPLKYTAFFQFKIMAFEIGNWWVFKIRTVWHSKLNFEEFTIDLQIEELKHGSENDLHREQEAKCLFSGWKESSHTK